MDIRKYNREQLGQLLIDDQYRQAEGIELDAKMKKKIYNRRSNLKKKELRAQQNEPSPEPPSDQQPEQKPEPIPEQKPEPIPEQKPEPIPEQPTFEPEQKPEQPTFEPEQKPEQPKSAPTQNDPPKSDIPDIPEDDDYSLIDDFADQYGNAEPKDAINALHSVIKSIKSEHANLRSKHLANTAYERLRTLQNRANPDTVLKAKINYISKWGNDTTGNKEHLFNLLSPAHSAIFGKK